MFCRGPALGASQWLCDNDLSSVLLRSDESPGSRDSAVLVFTEFPWVNANRRAHHNHCSTGPSESVNYQSWKGPQTSCIEPFFPTPEILEAQRVSMVCLVKCGPEIQVCRLPAQGSSHWPFKYLLLITIFHRDV